MDPSIERDREQFQADLDALYDCATLVLGLPRERPGPVVIRTSAVIDGQGLTIWAMHGPVLTIEADRVTLRNLRIEYTGEDSPQLAAENCALLCRARDLVLENVEVRGNVAGLPEEEGLWRYPHQLQLGQLAQGMEHTCLLRLAVPVPCRLTSEIAGLEVEPRSLPAGLHEVRLHIERLPADTLLSGTLTLQSAFLRRHLIVNAHVQAPREDLPPPTSEPNRLVWQPTDWDSLDPAVPVVSVKVAPPPHARPVPAPPPPVAPPPAPVARSAPPPAPVARSAPPSPPVPVAQPASAPPAPVPVPAPTPVSVRSSGGLRRTSGSPLGQLFSPPAETTPPAPATPVPEALPPVPTVPALFQDTPAASGAAPPPPSETPAPPRPRPRKSVPVRPASSLFTPAPAPGEPAAGPAEPPAVAPMELPATPPAPPVKKRARSTTLPSIFGQTQSHPESGEGAS